MQDKCVSAILTKFYGNVCSKTLFYLFIRLIQKIDSFLISLQNFFLNIMLHNIILIYSISEIFPG